MSKNLRRTFVRVRPIAQVIAAVASTIAAICQRIWHFRSRLSTPVNTFIGKFALTGEA